MQSKTPTAIPAMVRELSSPVLMISASEVASVFTGTAKSRVLTVMEGFNADL